MSVEFSAKISMLRKEKNVTQKQAAADLQISQALLSHYEKGIRECNLDFVKRTARYYGVTADYLLGLTDLKHGAGGLLDAGELDGDGEYGARTLLRALLWLYTDAENGQGASPGFFRDYFALCLRQYGAWISGAPEAERRQNELCAALLAQEYQPAGDLQNAPAAVRTVEDYAAGRVGTLLQKQ